MDFKKLDKCVLIHKDLPFFSSFLQCAYSPRDLPRTSEMHSVFGSLAAISSHYDLTFHTDVQ